MKRVKVVDLTIEQTEMLFDVSELHFLWYQKTGNASTTSLEALLQFNHYKLSNMINDSESNLTIEQAMFKLKSCYEFLLNNLREPSY